MNNKTTILCQEVTILQALVQNPLQRQQLILACSQLVEKQVDYQAGVAGFALKSAFKIVSRVRPDFVSHALHLLIDEFIEQLSPHYQRYTETASSQSLVHYFTEHQLDIANSLLQVTDGRVAEARPSIQKTYHALRKTGVKHVAEAIPSLASVLEQHGIS